MQKVRHISGVHLTNSLFLCDKRRLAHAQKQLTSKDDKLGTLNHGKKTFLLYILIYIFLPKMLIHFVCALGHLNNIK